MRKNVVLFFSIFLLLGAQLFAGDLSAIAQIGFVNNSNASAAYRLGFSRKAETQPLEDDSSSLTEIDMIYLLDQGYFHSSYFYAYFQSFSVTPMRVELHAQYFRANTDQSNKISWMHTGDLASKDSSIVADSGYDIAFEIVDEHDLNLTEEDLARPRTYNCSILIAVEGASMTKIDETGYTADFMLKLISED